MGILHRAARPWRFAIVNSHNTKATANRAPGASERVSAVNGLDRGGLCPFRLSPTRLSSEVDNCHRDTISAAEPFAFLASLKACYSGTVGSDVAVTPRNPEDADGKPFPASWQHFFVEEAAKRSSPS